MATKFVNVSRGGADGVQLLLATLQGLRQEEIAAGSQMVQLKAIEAELQGANLRHVREMTALAQQRQQFLVESGQRDQQIDHATAVLSHEKDKLGQDALNRQAQILQTTSSLYNELNKVVDSEFARGVEIQGAMVQNNDKLSEANNLTAQYIYGERIDQATGKPDGSGVIVLKDNRLNQLYESLSKAADGKFMSMDTFGRTWMGYYETALQDNLGQDPDSAYRTATEYATTGLVAASVLQMGDKAHSELQRAADSWIKYGDKNAGKFLGESIGFDKGGIIFDRKLDNKNMVGNGIGLVANGQRWNPAIREYAEDYRTITNMNKSLDKLFLGSQDRMLQMQDRSDLMGLQLDSVMANTLGDAYITDHPNLTPVSGEDRGQEDGATGLPISPPGTAGGPVTPPVAPPPADPFAFDPNAVSGIQEAPTAPTGKFPTIGEGQLGDSMALINEVGADPDFDKDGNVIFTVRPYYDMSSGVSEKIEGRQIPMTDEMFTISGTKERRTVGLGKEDLGMAIPRSSIDTKARDRIMNRAGMRRDLRMRMEQVSTPLYQELDKTNPWFQPQDSATPAPPGGMNANVQTQATGIEQNQPIGPEERQTELAGSPLPTGETFYQSMQDTLTQQMQGFNFKNPSVIAELGAIQSTLETGHGKSARNNAYFGVKGTGPDSFTTETKEEVDGRLVSTQGSFRGYGTPGESAKGYLEFLSNNPRYEGVLNATNIDEALTAIGQSGYATDSAYEKKLRDIYEGREGKRTAKKNAASRKNENILKGYLNARIDRNVGIGLAAEALYNEWKKGIFPQGIEPGDDGVTKEEAKRILLHYRLVDRR